MAARWQPTGALIRMPGCDLGSRLDLVHPGHPELHEDQRRGRVAHLADRERLVDELMCLLLPGTVFACSASPAAWGPRPLKDEPRNKVLHTSTPADENVRGWAV